MCSNPTAIIYFPCYVEIISRDDKKKVVRKAVYTIYVQRLCLLPYLNLDIRGLTNLLLTVKKKYSYIITKYTWVIDKIKVKGLSYFLRYKMLRYMCWNIIKTLSKNFRSCVKRRCAKMKMIIGDEIPWFLSRFLYPLH